MTCPIEFELNCKYANVLCHKCRGKDVNLPDLYYEPLIDSPLKEDHPGHIPTQVIKAKKREGRKNNKLGRKGEAEVNKELGARHNISSIGVDGVLEDLQLNLEIKTRLTEKGSPWPSKQEWEKAKATGIDIVIIKAPGNINHARVCMDLSTLKTLLERIDRQIG